LAARTFIVLRIGIGHPGHRDPVVDYVLRKPSGEDRRLIEDAIYDSLDVMPDVIAGQLDKAMHTLHTSK